MRLQKYDVLSCGMGALACTSFFVYNGQDPGTALSITLMATISGLVSYRGPYCASSSLYLFLHSCNHCMQFASSLDCVLEHILHKAILLTPSPVALQVLNELLFENADARW